MRKSIQLVVLSMVLRAPGSGQALPPGSASGSHEEMFRREFVIRQLDEQNRKPDSDAAERREEQYRQRQFLEKANAFVQMWSVFAKEFNEKKTFNLKTAEKITRAFHELEASKDWPHSAGNSPAR
jgi:hypothetical protein